MKKSKDVILGELVSRIASEAVREVLSPIRENREIAHQKALKAELEDLEQGGTGKPTLNSEADESESGENEKEGGEDAKPKVTKKMALGKEEPKAPKAIIPDPRDIRDVTFSQVINMMNMMRSGKSAKDPEVKEKLNQYFGGLEMGERQALFVLLSGLTQILAGGVPGDDAPDPSDVGIEIQPKKAQGGEKSDQKGKKAPAPPEKAPPTKPTRDNNLPIVVGEAADKSAVIRKLALLRR